MEKSDFFSIPELSKYLGISRIAVYKKVKMGQIKAIKIGRNYAIPKDQYLNNVLNRELKEDEKKQVEKAVKKTIREYGEALKLLGKGW